VVGVNDSDEAAAGQEYQFPGSRMIQQLYQSIVRVLLLHEVSYRCFVFFEL